MCFIRNLSVPGHVKQNNGFPKNPTPRACEDANLEGKGDFATLIKLRILRCGESPRSPRWAQ